MNNKPIDLKSVLFTLSQLQSTLEALSQREVAQRLGISESTVEKHMSRGFYLLTALFTRGGKLAPGASKASDEMHEAHVLGDGTAD